jgi:epoxyqueuosine reductase
MSGKLAFLDRLEKMGYCASVVSIDHLGELGEEIGARHDHGELNGKFYHEYENPYFHPKLPSNFKDARSIVVMATPQSMIRTSMRWKGKELKLIVPPTYYDSDKVIRDARKALKKALGPKKHRLVRAVLPQKLLAVRSGLAMYGKNNITYVPRFGSLYRLTSFYTDFDSPIDCWREKKALPKCSLCKACRNACPTGAIRDDRFLIHVERCLTYLNEKKSEEPFPKWVPGNAHNALIGCMRCQRACPYDREFINRYEERGSFSEEETKYLLSGNFMGPKGKAMERKLKRIGLDLTTFPRNLRMLVPKR